MAEDLLGAVVPDTSPAVFPDTKELKGKHVVLKLTQESDFKALWESVGRHSEIFKFWPAGPYTEPSAFDTEMKELLEMKNIITYTAFVGGEAVGNTMLLPTNLEGRVMEIGMIYGPAMQRTRAATEAIYLLACLSFDKHNNRRLEWKTTLLNKPSQRAAERLGLTYEGCLRQAGIQKGRNRDTVWYSMIDSEWPVAKRAFELWLDDSNFDGDGKQKRGLKDIRDEIADEK